MTGSLFAIYCNKLTSYTYIEDLLRSQHTIAMTKNQTKMMIRTALTPKLINNTRSSLLLSLCSKEREATKQQLC